MKNDLTIEEWKEVGNKAKQIIQINHEFFLLLRDKFPKTIWEKKWLVSEKAFGNIRSHLDDVICSKFLDLPSNQITSIFYGDGK